jgi:hypothetical protein
MRNTLMRKREGEEARAGAAQLQAKQGNLAGGRGTDPTGGAHLSVAEREREEGEDGPAAGGWAAAGDRT